MSDKEWEKRVERAVEVSTYWFEKFNAANERIKRLEEWKESAMAVEREWNPNSLSKMLGGQLGESQRVVIMREVPKLKERINQLKEALGLVVPHCSWVHHSKKHQHKYGEPCPVVALIEKAKEAKP